MAAHEALRQARLRRHWTQEQLAIQLNTTRITVNRWERGNGTPGPYFRRLLFELFGEDFFHESETEMSGDEEEEKAPGRRPAIWMVPFARNPFFTGREATLRHLALSFRATGHAALTQVQIISALGGMGKTQTALEYVYRFQESYTAVIWLRAENRESLFADVARLVTTLNLPEKQEHNTRSILHAVQRWLAEHTNWLVIFDNVEDLAVVRELLPAQFVGHVLVTTQLQATGTLVHRLDLQPLPPDEGCLFVLRRAKFLPMQANLEELTEDVRNQAEEICQILGGLPLALDQAGAYLEETSCTLAEYLQRLHTRQLPLLSRRGQESTIYPAPVTATILLALERVQQMAPAALEILRFCAFLAADAIPEELITAGGEQELGPVLHEAVVDGFSLDEAFAALSMTSLLTRNVHTRLLTMHRVVQTVIREQLDVVGNSPWFQRALLAVNRSLPVSGTKKVTLWPQCDRLLPHAQILLDAAEKRRPGEEQPEEMLLIADLWFKTASHLAARGNDAQAEPLLQRCLRVREQVLGPGHLAGAQVLTTLGWIAREQGRLTEAEAHLRRALTISEQHLGLLHLDLCRILTNLAMMAMDRGIYQEAEALMKRVLTIRERLQGSEHEERAIALSDLAIIYRRQGREKEAETLYLRAIQLEEQRRGPMYLALYYPLANLANLYCEQGRYVEAEPLYQRALQVGEQAWGPEHSTSASALCHLGDLYREQGRYVEAESVYQRALQIWERTAGPNHPEVARALHGLAQLRAAQDKLEKAESLARRALQIREQAEYEKHPDLAESLHILARLYRKQGRDQEAEPLYLRALSIYEQTKGPTHPTTQIVRDEYRSFQREPSRGSFSSGEDSK